MFKNRTDAGKQLARKLTEYQDSKALILGIPMGGAPVAYEVARELKADLDFVIPRKLPIPWNPESGFGAMTVDGGIILNRELVDSVRINKAQIEVVTDMVKTEIKRRNSALRGGRGAPDAAGRAVIIVDDGLASGYTMLAAIRYVRSLNPEAVIAAAAAASTQAARLVESEADRLVVLIVSSQIPFAVADFYLEWRDLTDREVIGYLIEPLQQSNS